jgi:hypothetical protein
MRLHVADVVITGNFQVIPNAAGKTYIPNAYLQKGVDGAELCAQVQKEPVRTME